MCEDFLFTSEVSTQLTTSFLNHSSLVIRVILNGLTNIKFDYLIALYWIQSWAFV